MITSQNRKKERWRGARSQNKMEDTERQRETHRTRQTITREKENKGEEYGRERETVVKRRGRVWVCK